MGNTLKKKKIHTLCFIGGEDVSARISIANKIIAKGYNVEIIGSQDEDIFIAENITYTKYRLYREFNLLKDFQAIKDLRRILSRNNYSIIHSFDTKPTIIAPLASRRLNNTIVIRTITGIGRLFAEDKLRYKLIRVIYKIMQRIIKSHVDYTIFQNEDDFQFFIKEKLINKEKATIIKSSGVDINFYRRDNVDPDKIEALKKELELDDQNITFILISRLVKQKGILTYLEAAKECYKKGYRFNFLLAGAIDIKKDAITIGEIDKYAEFIKYLGKRSDIRELLYLSDVFALPSYYREGMPRVLLEAGAMGLSLITTNMPGCKDFVKNHWNGLLIEPKKSSELANACINIATNKNLRKKFSQNNIKQIKQFSLDYVSDQYIKLYEKLLNSR